MTLTLVENPDIIASVAALPTPPFLVGFAAETENLLAYASDKLNRKGLDLIVANDVADSRIGFNSDNNGTTIISKDKVIPLAVASKRQVSVQIIQVIADLINTRELSK